MPIHATHPRTGDTITASVAGAAIVISPRYGTSASFDQAGRLLGLFVGERSYQRTLDNRVLERTSGPGARRRELPPGEAAALIERIFADLRDVAEHVPALDLSPGDRDRLREALARVLAFGPLVLQATEGCSWNRCTFCGLYRDRAFRIHSPEAFRAHCEAVRDFYGAGISLRRGIFLADANALVTPQKRLVALLEVAQAIFGLPDGPRPIYSFVSAFDVERKSPADWAALHGLGVQRAYIGLETGDDELLRFLNKPGRAQDAIEAVRALRAGGVSAGVIVMAGIGGEQFAGAHMAHTLDAIRAMDLGPDDLVYLSEYVPAPGTEYPAQAEAAGIRPLSDHAIAAQLHVLQTRLRERMPGVRVAPYRVDGFAL